MRPFGNDITNIANNNGNQNPNNNGQGNDGNNENNGDGNDPRIPAYIARIGGVFTFSKEAGQSVIRVVSRCEDAKENSILDLSKCELMSIPDAVYHLMRNTELRSCDLSGNELKKIAPRFALKFSLLTELNLSGNQVARLPDELADLQSLERLNISYNSFIVLPPVVFKMKNLKELDASHNKIIEIDTDEMIVSDALELVDLRENPLGRFTRRKLENIQTPFRIEISEYNEDDDF